MISLRDPHRGIGRLEGEMVLAIVPVPVRVNRARIVRSEIYHSFEGYHLVCAVGLEFDGMSDPALAHLELGDALSSCAARSSAFHDSPYRLGVELHLQDNGSIVEVPVTKEQADLRLWDLCLCVGYDETLAAAIYEGVRFGGWPAWNINRAKEKICNGDRLRLLGMVN